MRTHFLQEETLNPSPLEDNAIRVVVIVKVEAYLRQKRSGQVQASSHLIIYFQAYPAYL